MERIMLVEDHASFRQTLALVLDMEPGFEVVAQVGTLAEARKVAEDLDDGIDVAVLDLDLPDGEGIELIPEIGEAHPGFSALVLTASLERADVARAVEAGAAGVLHKTAEVDEIIAAVRGLVEGETLLSEAEVVEMLRVANQAREESREARKAVESLTRRELEVLRALAEGLSNKEIAQKMHVSVETERTHMMNIMSKLGAHSRLQALLFAVRHGIIELH